MLSVGDLRHMRLDTYYEKLTRRYDRQPAIKTADRVLTYQELDDKSARLASVYRSIGLDTTHRVGILMHNRPEYIIADMGAARAGVVSVPLNNQLDAEHLQDILVETEITALVVGPGFLDTVASLRQELFDIQYIIGITDGQQLPVGFHEFEDLIDRESPDPPTVQIDPDDPAGVFHTGGTTGPPKGVVHSHQGLILNAFAHVQELDLHRNERVLVTTPLAHSANFIVRAALVQGATIVLQQGFDAERVIDTIESETITWTFLVPTMISRLLHHDRLSATAIDSLETLVYGASSMPPALLREGINKLGQVFIQLYGLMEAPNLVTTLPKDRHDPDDPAALRSVGFPTQFADVKLIDENRRWSDDIGEIAVRSPFAMKGYTGRPRESEWIKTGDLGRIDENGRVVVLDRIQNLIRVDDELVYSTKVENILQKHPKVRQAAVIGVPADREQPLGPVDRRYIDQEVKAVVAANSDGRVEPGEIIQFCEGALDDREIPASVDVVGKLPETPFGKVDKSTLREPYW